MKKTIFTLALSFILCISMNAQDFDSAVGLRLGFPSGITYKKFISDSNALEFYGGYRGYILARSISLHGAYQIHKDIDEVDGLQWYYGGGAALFLWSDDFNGSSTQIGLQGYIGLSYTLTDTPVNITVDWVPTFSLGNGLGNLNSGFGGGYYSVGVRYVLGGQDGA